MEYSTKDIVTWVFTHPDLKSATENYIYLCNEYVGDYTKYTNSDFINAIDGLWQIVAIGNPQVCAGLFAKASKLFENARKTQKDEGLILSYVGQMFCNHWMGQGYLNTQIQAEIATLEYKGSFWERNNISLERVATGALAAAGMLFGLSPGQAAGVAGKNDYSQRENLSAEFQGKIKHFNELRNAILSLKF